MKKKVTVAVVLAVLIAGIAMFRFVTAGQGAFEATPNPRERLEAALEQNRPVFIEFYADRCPACVTMKPIIADLKNQYGKDIEFILADTDGTGLDLAIEYQVMFIPAYVFINAEGERVGGEMSGFMPKGELESLLQKIL